MRHYLDHASTTPLRPRARAAMAEWIDRLGAPDGSGDPGRVHEEGRLAREAIELARAQVAELLGVSPRSLVFTSGATEAANTAVSSALAVRAGQVVCSPVEHSAVRLASERAGEVIEWPVEATGELDLQALVDILATPAGIGLVNCQWANHEVGTVQPLEQVAKLCAQAGVPLHVDGAAAFGHLSPPPAMSPQYLSLSAHKMGGPAGVGALVLGQGTRLNPLLIGGSEERSRRAGAENLLGIVGFGAAAAELCEESRLSVETERSRRLVTSAVAGATALEGVALLGPQAPEKRLPHIATFLVEGVFGEAVLLGLDRAGIAAHSGSACSSEAFEPSPVLSAMGADPDRSLRVSFGWSSEKQDATAFAANFGEIVRELRSLGTAS